MGNRTRLNFIIDALALAAITLLISTGVILHYQLPPGSGHRLSIWGLGRHDWGEVHLILSLVFLGVLSCHLFLHWRWVASVARGREHQQSGSRLLLGIIGVLALLAIALAPVLSPVTSDVPHLRGDRPSVSSQKFSESYTGFKGGPKNR